jgi:hypothetical protein
MQKVIITMQIKVKITYEAPRSSPFITTACMLQTVYIPPLYLMPRFIVEYRGQEALHEIQKIATISHKFNRLFTAVSVTISQDNGLDLLNAIPGVQEVHHVVLSLHSLLAIIPETKSVRIAAQDTKSRTTFLKNSCNDRSSSHS